MCDLSLGDPTSNHSQAKLWGSVQGLSGCVEPIVGGSSVPVNGNPIRIVLDVQLVDDSPIGLITTADGANRDFAGWLALLSVLEALLDSSSQSDDLVAG